MKTLKLEKQETSKKSSHALAGANIRKELKHKYPNCKFSVTTESFAGGTALNVIWFDGVTEQEVEAITNKYVYGKWCGMEDIYNYDKDHDSSYGDVKYLHTNRKYSKEVIQEGIEYCNFDEEIEVKVSDYDGHAFIQMDDRDREFHIYDYIRNKSFYVESVPVHSETQELDNTSNEEIYKAGAIEDYTHTKTKEVLKVLKVAGSLTKEVFSSFRNYMKQEHQAYYSRYAGGFILAA